MSDLSRRFQPLLQGSNISAPAASKTIGISRLGEPRKPIEDVFLFQYPSPRPPPPAEIKFDIHPDIAPDLDDPLLDGLSDTSEDLRESFRGVMHSIVSNSATSLSFRSMAFTAAAGARRTEVEHRADEIEYPGPHLAGHIPSLVPRIEREDISDSEDENVGGLRVQYSTLKSEILRQLDHRRANSQQVQMEWAQAQCGTEIARDARNGTEISHETKSGTEIAREALVNTAMSIDSLALSSSSRNIAEAAEANSYRAGIVFHNRTSIPASNPLEEERAEKESRPFTTSSQSARRSASPSKISSKSSREASIETLQPPSAAIAESIRQRINDTRLAYGATKQVIELTHPNRSYSPLKKASERSSASLSAREPSAASHFRAINKIQREMVPLISLRNSLNVEKKSKARKRASSAPRSRPAQSSAVGAKNGHNGDFRSRIGLVATNLPAHATRDSSIGQPNQNSGVDGLIAGRESSVFAALSGTDGAPTLTVLHTHSPAAERYKGTDGVKSLNGPSSNSSADHHTSVHNSNNGFTQKGAQVPQVILSDLSEGNAEEASRRSTARSEEDTQDWKKRRHQEVLAALRNRVHDIRELI